MQFAWLALRAAAFAVALSCGAATAEEPARSGTPHYGTWGFDLAGRDLAVRPGQNFDRHSNGTFYRNTPIPPDKVAIGAFMTLEELSEARMLALVKAQAAAPESEDGKRIAALYRAFMDEARIEAADARPLQADLAAIRAATSREDIARLMGRAQGLPGGSFFATDVAGDARDPTRNALILMQAGLGLPERDYYLAAPFAPVREAYVTYLHDVLTGIGWPDARQAAADIFALEKRIAEVHWTLAQRRDANKTYNPMSVDALEAFAPGFPWRAWLEGGGCANVTRVVVTEKSAFPLIARIFSETPIATLQAWQAAQTTDQASPFLSKRFVDRHFAFRGKLLRGQKQSLPRERLAVEIVDRLLGDPLGRLYVARHFPPSSKAKMEKLVADLLVAMRARIQKLEWMSPATREQALDKLARFRVKIGYPSRWRSSDGLVIDETDLYGSVIAAGRFNRAFLLGKLDRPADREEWGMTPQQVNAYYNPTNNEIVFPAAILQPPFFDPEADPAVNYGGIGAVIGHEITHGFDDQGRKTDGYGVLRDWWTTDDAREFDARAGALADQYSRIEALPGARVNGRQTLGENIADLGGVLVALDAYRLSLNGATPPVLDGLTGEQRFFYGWAQVWRSALREEITRQLLAVDVHTPSPLRAWAPLRNVDAWYDSFDVRPDDDAYLPPTNRVRIW